MSEIQNSIPKHHARGSPGTPLPPLIPLCHLLSITKSVTSRFDGEEGVYAVVVRSRCFVVMPRHHWVGVVLFDWHLPIALVVLICWSVKSLSLPCVHGLCLVVLLDDKPCHWWWEPSWLGVTCWPTYSELGRQHLPNIPLTCSQHG